MIPPSLLHLQLISLSTRTKPQPAGPSLHLLAPSRRPQLPRHVHPRHGVRDLHPALHPPRRPARGLPPRSHGPHRNGRLRDRSRRDTRPQGRDIHSQHQQRKPASGSGGVQRV